MFTAVLSIVIKNKNAESTGKKNYGKITPYGKILDISGISDSSENQ